MKLGGMNETTGKGVDILSEEYHLVIIFLIRGVRYSGIAVMSLEGIHDVQIVGSVNGEEFVTETLMPILNPFDGTNTRSVVIMDNCSIHHVDPVVHLIETVAQAKLVFLPPYSSGYWRKSSTK